MDGEPSIVWEALEKLEFVYMYIWLSKSKGTRVL